MSTTGETESWPSLVDASSLERHLTEICAKLELDPVLRHLQEMGHLTREMCEAIRNPHNHETREARNEALVAALKTDAQCEAFVQALRLTKQGGLVELLDPLTEGLVLPETMKPKLRKRMTEYFAEMTTKDGRLKRRTLNAAQKALRKARPDIFAPPQHEDDKETMTGKESELTVSSVRSRHMREVIWECDGITSCGSVRHWQQFQWCRKCRKFLCTDCQFSDEHKAFKHKAKHMKNVKIIMQASFLTLQDKLLEGKVAASVEIAAFVAELEDQLVSLAHERIEKDSLATALKEHFKMEATSAYNREAEPITISDEESEAVASKAVSSTAATGDLPKTLPPKYWSAEAAAPIAAVLIRNLFGEGETSNQSGSESHCLEQGASTSDNKVGAIATGGTGLGNSSTGIWIAGGQGHERSLTVWQPDSGATRRWDGVFQSPRGEGHRCVGLGTPELLVIGGGNKIKIDNSIFSSTSLRSSVEGVAFGEAPHSRPSPALPLTLSTFAATTIAGKVFVSGGFSRDGSTLSDLGTHGGESERDFNLLRQKECFLFDDSSAEWRSTAPMRVERTFHSAVAVGDCVWALGGQNPALNEFITATESTEFYNATVEKWYDFTPLPRKLSRAAAIDLEGRIILTGGHARYGTLTTLMCDPREGRWLHGSPMIKLRWEHGLVEWRGRVYALGGDLPREGTAEVYEPRMGTWEMVPRKDTPELPEGAAFAAFD